MGPRSLETRKGPEGKVSRATVYRLIAEGKVRAVRVSHAIRILLTDVAGASKGSVQDCGSGG